MTGAPEEQIASFIARFASPPPDQVTKFVRSGRRLLAPRRTLLVELGATDHDLFFVHSGVVRYFVVVPATGEEITKDFSFPPGFATSFGSAVQQLPARVGIAAVQDCVVTRWKFEAMNALFEQDPQWQKFGRVIAEWLYVRKENRELSLLSRTAEERYIDLLDNQPDSVAALPQHALASYLGIAPESLSRLKSRLSGGRRNRSQSAGGPNF